MARSSLPNIAVPDAASRGQASGRSIAIDLLISLRPDQWTKNLLVFAALLFGRHLFDLGATLRVFGAFGIFCALSGTVYLINDVVDREGDRRHVHKATRPIASGAITPALGLSAAVVLGIGALTCAFWLEPRLGLVSAAYVGLLVFYSGVLKHLVILDVMTIAIGFVLRAVAGGVVIDVPISGWLLVCTSLLALFLALSKRRHEIVALAADASGHRPILGEYSPYLLDQMIAVVTASTLIAYIFYAISPEVAAKFGTPWLGLTIPFPLYGIFRYLYLVHQKAGGGSPTELLVMDRPLLACVVLWALGSAVIIYQPIWGMR